MLEGMSVGMSVELMASYGQGWAKVGREWPLYRFLGSGRFGG